jgi:6-pyruvoyl-tetrahydropterin synthase
MIFDYQISATFRRKHFNLPHADHHYHDFRVTLHLQAERHKGEMYGLDMCEVERLLQATCDRIPDVVNDLISSGTTEEMCLWFGFISLPSNVKLIQVDVAETPERVTSWRFNRAN